MNNGILQTFKAQNKLTENEVRLEFYVEWAKFQRKSNS